MVPVVTELQRDALNRNVRVSDLLRKALVVARKLSLCELKDWIEKELNGYQNSNDIPSYREVVGEVRGWDPSRGWVPVIFKDPRRGDLFSRRKCGQSIAELEYLVERNAEDSYLHIPFSQELQRKLCSGFGFETEVSLFTQHTGIIRIIDAVRTIILNWALKLEEEGILGEDLSFTSQEKEAAVRSSQNVTNFYGPVQSPQIQQGGDQPIQVSVTFDLDAASFCAFAQSLRASIKSLELPDEQERETEAELRTVEAQLESPKPKPSIVRESLQSVRRILEGAGSGAAGHLLVELGKLLQ